MTPPCGKYHDGGEGAIGGYLTIGKGDEMSYPVAQDCRGDAEQIDENEEKNDGAGRGEVQL